MSLIIDKIKVMTKMMDNYNSDRTLLVIEIMTSTADDARCKLV